MIFKYKGYGYRLVQRDKDAIRYKVKKLKWHWYKRAEVLATGYDVSYRWLFVDREKDEITEEFILKAHREAQKNIDKFVFRDEEVLKMEELLREPNMDFMSRVMK